MDGAKHISFNRCALNSIPMVKDNIMEVGTTIKLKALVVQISKYIKQISIRLFLFQLLIFVSDI